MNKKAKSLTNINTYIVLIFIFLLLSIGLIYTANETITNPHSNLDNDSIEYIAQLNNIDLSELGVERGINPSNLSIVSSDELENPILITANYSQGNPKDYALDFQFAKEKASFIEIAGRGIFLLPEAILFDMLRLPKNNWQWIVDILNWLWWIFIALALIYLARGILDKY